MVFKGLVSLFGNAYNYRDPQSKLGKDFLVMQHILGVQEDLSISLQ